MSITFSVIFEEVELDVSSFSYRSDGNGTSGGCVVKGVEYLEFISDNIASGVLSLMINDTEILTCSLDADVKFTLGPTSDSIQLTFGDDIVFSQSVATTFDIDDLSATTAMSGGYWSFRLPEIDAGYQSGMSVLYLGVDRYILSVSVTCSDTDTTVTLTEGPEGASEDSEEIEEGLPVCTYELSINESKTVYWSTSCSLGYGTIGEKISPKGYAYDLMLFKCAQFEIVTEGQYQVEFVAYPRPSLDFTTTGTGLGLGTEFDLVQGVYTPFTNPSPTVKTFRGDGFFLGTLTPGIYTAIAEFYVDRATDPAWINWLTQTFYIIVRD